jgi:heme/copper-type cytochrome/quinol oxidase subunit 2
MRGLVIVETQTEFDRWLAGKQSQYAMAQSAIKPADPLPTSTMAPVDASKPASKYKQQ